MRKTSVAKRSDPSVARDSHYLSLMKNKKTIARSYYGKTVVSHKSGLVLPRLMGCGDRNSCVTIGKTQKSRHHKFKILQWLVDFVLVCVESLLRVDIQDLLACLVGGSTGQIPEPPQLRRQGHYPESPDRTDTQIPRLFNQVMQERALFGEEPVIQ